MDISIIIELLKMIVIIGGLVLLVKISPIDETIKKLGTVVVILIAILWALTLVANMVK